MNCNTTHYRANSSSVPGDPTLKIGFAEAVAYRAELVVWMLTTTMPLVSLALWSALAETGPIGRFAARDFAAYFLATLVVRQLTGSWLVWEMNQDIKSGMLSRRLLRPIHPLLAYSAENLAAIPLRALMCAPILVIAVASTRAFHVADPVIWLVFVLSLLGAWALNFFVMAIVGTLAFFVESSLAFFDVWMMAFMILSGYLVPLELFPGWTRAVADALPFRYMLGFPVELATGLLGRGDALRRLAIEGAWVLGAATTALLLWRAGMRRFAAYGG